MKRFFCNPINIDYHYQFIIDNFGGGDLHISREAADPTFLYWKGKYYIFASMNLSVWVSENLAEWKSVRLPDNLPLYDYAPDVRAIGEYVYFCASKRGEICNFYRTKDIEKGPYEEIKGTFDFWDPDLFEDDDGRLYLYWGCSNTTPIWGVELDPESMKPLSDRIELIHKRPKELGYERVGENHSKSIIEGDELEKAFENFKSQIGEEAFANSSDVDKAFFKSMLSNNPFIEGAYMNKHNGKYYLQYAATGAEYNVYCDGVYVSDSPLGPFVLADNNPYSYQPGGYMPGAGHGSTMEDRNGNVWHTSTSRISLNDPMERRVGIWRAGFDKDGDLFCNTSYSDWPQYTDDRKLDPWAEPEWYLLSSGAKMTASSYCTADGEPVTIQQGSVKNTENDKTSDLLSDCIISAWDTISLEKDNAPFRASEENVQTFWRAAGNEPGEWLKMDLGEIQKVNAIQINFADDHVNCDPLPDISKEGLGARTIDDRHHRTRWILEGSIDDEKYIILCDKSDVETNLPHDFIVINCDSGEQLRYIKLTVIETPFGQNAAISGLRVFGKGNGETPEKADFNLTKTGDLDMLVKMKADKATGFNICWGYKQDKLYHSFMYYLRDEAEKAEQKIGALIKGKNVYVRVDSFNENGITHGDIKKL